jgi:hypothetical protein
MRQNLKIINWWVDALFALHPDMASSQSRRGWNTQHIHAREALYVHVHKRGAGGSQQPHATIFWTSSGKYTCQINKFANSLLTANKVV